VSKLRQGAAASSSRRATTSRTRPDLRQDGTRELARHSEIHRYDLPLRSLGLDDLHILGDLADTSTEASAPSRVHRLPRRPISRRAPKASFRLGREKFEKKLRLDEGITSRPIGCWQSRLRELHEAQEEFRDRGRLNGGDPRCLALGERTAPAPASSSKRRRRRSRSSRLPPPQAIVTFPTRSPSCRAHAGILSLDIRVDVDARPFETKPSRAYYYLTDVDRSWPAERQEEHMRDLQLPTLWNISIHEVYPVISCTYQHLRQVESKVRKSTFFAPAPFVEGGRTTASR
jgi:hypothetical protein